MQREPHPSRPRHRYIAIDGPIGVGKTSLAQVLTHRLGSRLVLEDIAGNPFLPRFYQEPDKFAFQTQLYFLLTRYSQQRELAQQELFAEGMISDYLFAKDRIFASINLTPDEFALYEQVFNSLDAAMVKPDLVVYLNARIEVLVARLRRRNWDFERYISLEYLDRIAAAYRDFFFYYDDSPLLVVDCSETDFLSNPADLAALLTEIGQTHAGTHHYVPRKT